MEGQYLLLCQEQKLTNINSNLPWKPSAASCKPSQDSESLHQAILPVTACAVTVSVGRGFLMHPTYSGISQRQEVHRRETFSGHMWIKSCLTWLLVKEMHAKVMIQYHPHLSIGKKLICLWIV